MKNFKLDITSNPECSICIDALIYTINKSFNFIEYNNSTKFFTFDDDVNRAEVQALVDTFKCDNVLYETVLNQEYDLVAIKKDTDPTITSNLELNIIWLNVISGELFTCTDNTPNLNTWVGTKTNRIIRPTPLAGKFDILEDGSSLGFWPFDTKSVNDIGGKYNGNPTGIHYGKGLSDGWHLKSARSSTVSFNIPMSTLDAVTVMMWVKWNGNNSTMPVGFDAYDIYMYNGVLGFNTGQGDCSGIDFKSYKHKWVYAAMVFKQNELGEIYMNGINTPIDNVRGTFSSANAHLTDKLTIFGWGISSGYRHFGEIDRLRLFNRELTPDEIKTIYDAETNYIGGV